MARRKYPAKRVFLTILEILPGDAVQLADYV